MGSMLYVPRERPPWAVTESGLWLRAGFVAASVAALGVATLADAARGAPSTGLALVLGGAAAAYGAFRRARTVLADMEASDGERRAPTIVTTTGVVHP